MLSYGYPMVILWLSYGAGSTLTGASMQFITIGS